MSSSASPIKVTESLAVRSATAPVKITFPLSITTTWLHVCSTSDSKWLDNTTVRPSAAYAANTERMALICGGSSPLVGSSSTSRSGKPNIAWAMPSRCRIPWL